MGALPAAFSTLISTTRRSVCVCPSTALVLPTVLVSCGLRCSAGPFITKPSFQAQLLGTLLLEHVQDSCHIALGRGGVQLKRDESRRVNRSQHLSEQNDVRDCGFLLLRVLFFSGQRRGKVGRPSNQVKTERMKRKEKKRKSGDDESFMYRRGYSRETV